MHKLLQDSPGKEMLLLGNEAIARGALEAGVAFATCYPGTPSSEIPEQFFNISQETDLYFEYSTNEKVAVEVGAGAAVSGLRTMVTMKHVGLNVAADPVMTLAYEGVKGGMVIVNADDPSLFSSQNEQDNRYYARLSSLPMLEPTNAQEMKDMTVAAFDLSEELKLPVILRTTTRLNHIRGAVKLGELTPIKSKAKFEKNPFHWVAVPAVARKLHQLLLQKFDLALDKSEQSLYNEIIGDGKWGIVANGVSMNYVEDALGDLGITDKVINALEKEGLRVTPFERVESNPRVTTIDAAARIFREQKLDLIIALGGGSVMDAAKGVAMAVSGTKSIWHYIENQVHPESNVPPIIAIPTVAASGSESNCGAVITNWATHEKMVLYHKSLYPVVSIVDPKLTLNLPLKQTLQGVVDIFCHLLEPYLTDTVQSPLSDGIRETTMKIVVDNSSSVRNDLKNIRVRSQLSWASTIACSAFASLGGGGGGMSLHGIEHAISAYSDVAHGDGLAALLPAWMEYTKPVAYERFEQLGERVFQDKDLIGSIRQWLDDIGMSLRLRDIGIDRELLNQIAGTVQKTANWVTEHPRGMTVNDIIGIYESTY